MSDPARYSYPLPARDDDQLDAEVKAAGLPGYLGHCGNGPQVEVLFTDPLSAADLHRLDDLAAAHVPDPQGTLKRLRAMAKQQVTANDPARMAERVAFKRVVAALMAFRTWASSATSEINRLGGSVSPPPAIRDYATLEQVAQMDLDAGQGEATQ